MIDSRISVAASGAFILFLVVGCSSQVATGAPTAPPADGVVLPTVDESVTPDAPTDADCDTLMTTIEQAVNAARTIDPSDPASAGGFWGNLLTTVETGLDSIATGNLAANAEQVRTAMSDYGAYLDDVGENPSRLDPHGEHVAALQTALADAGEPCGG